MLNDDDLKCTLTPIVSMAQIPKDDEGWNVWPFFPLKAHLKNYFYPMVSKFDFVGDKRLSFEEIGDMKLSVGNMKDKSGQPATIQFFINKRKTVRDDSSLIYFNSGVFEAIPDESVFADLSDEEYHEIGNLFWKMWANIPWEAPRSTDNNFLQLIEPLTIKTGVKRINFRLTKNEDDFVSACIIPADWSNSSNVTESSLPEIGFPDENDAIMEWQSIRQEQNALQQIPIQMPAFQWKCAVAPDVATQIDIISKEIKELNCDTDARISMNSKVRKYETGLKNEILKILVQLKEFQAEKEFYTLNVKENEKLFNAYYLPQLHFVLTKMFKDGQKAVEIADQATQYEDPEDKLDWSGQWSDQESG